MGIPHPVKLLVNMAHARKIRVVIQPTENGKDMKNHRTADGGIQGYASPRKPSFGIWDKISPRQDNIPPELRKSACFLETSES